MTLPRIVLSVLLLLALAGSSLAQTIDDVDAAPDDQAVAAPDAATDNGIGTSPSADDESVVRAPLTPQLGAFPILAILAILAPLIQTVIGKVFTSQVKDQNRRTQILGYADTAFQLVETLGPQLGLSGTQKYLRFVQQVVDSLKSAGQPELTAQELQQLQQLASVKAMLAKTPARPLPLPPPPRG
jgi:hypothetical protein